MDMDTLSALLTIMGGGGGGSFGGFFVLAKNLLNKQLTYRWL